MILIQQQAHPKTESKTGATAAASKTGFKNRLKNNLIQKQFQRHVPSKTGQLNNWYDKQSVPGMLIKIRQNLFNNWPKNTSNIG